MHPNTLKQNLVAIKSEIEKCIQDEATTENQGVFRKDLSSVNIHGVQIPRVYWDSKKYRDLIEKVIVDKELSHIASNVSIIGGINRILKQLIEDNDDISAHLTEITRDLVASLKTTKEFIVYIPIKGCILEVQVIQFSEKIRLLKMDSEIAMNLIPNSSLDSNSIENLTPTALEIKIQTHDFEKAMELGIEIAKVLVNYLRFVDYYGWDEALSLGLPGYRSFNEALRPIAVSGNITISMGLIPSNNGNLTIDAVVLEDLHRLRYGYFGELLTKILNNDLKDMQKSVIRSLVWFGESQIDHDNAAQFLKLMLAIESIVHTNTSDPITATIREKVAFIIKDNMEERIEIASKMNDLYSLRSRIVHHASSTVNFKDLSELEHIAWSLLEVFLTNESWISLETKDQLQKKIEQMKYSSAE